MIIELMNQQGARELILNWKWVSLDIPINDVKEIKLLINDELIKKLNMDTKEDFDYIYKWSKIIYN